MIAPQTLRGPDAPAPLPPSANQECDRFEAAWKAGRRPRIEDLLDARPAAERAALLPALIALEIDYRRLAGERPAAEEFQARFPTLDRAWIERVLAGTPPPPTQVDPRATPEGRTRPGW